MVSVAGVAGSSPVPSTQLSVTTASSPLVETPMRREQSAKEQSSCCPERQPKTKAGQTNNGISGGNQGLARKKFHNARFHSARGEGVGKVPDQNETEGDGRNGREVRGAAQCPETKKPGVLEPSLLEPNVLYATADSRAPSVGTQALGSMRLGVSYTRLTAFAKTMPPCPPRILESPFRTEPVLPRAPGGLHRKVAVESTRGGLILEICPDLLRPCIP